MSKSQRWSARWFNFGLWVIAFIFGWFLIGLGGAIVGDLPKVEHNLYIEDFIDAAAKAPLEEIISRNETIQREASSVIEQAQLSLEINNQAYTSEKQLFENWLATRTATQLSDQNQEVINRTRNLDALKSKEREIRQEIDQQRQIQMKADQEMEPARKEINQLYNQARVQLDAETRYADLRIFLYRLAFTLPLLIIAGWLFARQRKSAYWPFVWGFIFFALFAFFLELVPYLPSYGGYVRYSVGVIITLLLGRYAIIALHRYLKRQQEIENLPDEQRRRGINYDMALARLAKNLCPGCERKVNLTDGITDFCPHCGISLFCQCSACRTRKSTFSHFCHVCGESDSQTAAVSETAVQ